jgi:TRAP-type C4-dicarboxylate transport system substrate-binding protein
VLGSILRHLVIWPEAEGDRKMDSKLCLRKMLQAGAVLALLFGGLGASGPALAQAVELKMGFYQPATHLYISVANQILPELEQRTHGRYKFGVYPSEMIGKAAEQLDLTNRGIVFANVIATAYYAGTYPLFNIETLPIWSEGVKGVAAAYRGGLNKLYEEYLHSRGMKNVGLMGAAYLVRSLGTKKKEIHSPSDFKGLRIRTLGLERVPVQLNGGAVLSIAMPEVYEALQRNMVDGVMAVETNWIDWKLNEVLAHITFLDLTITQMSLIYSISDMNRIPEADRRIVLEVLNKFCESLIAENTKFMDDARAFLTTKWKGKAFYLTPQEKQAFIKSAEGEAIKQYLEKTGDMGQKAIDIVKKYNP